MKSDEREKIATKTWARAVDPIKKAGYMDGAAYGQTATFQSSFDMGYDQGFSFGLELGFKEAIKSVQQPHNKSAELMDPRRINCQICYNNTTTQENVTNLFNLQNVKNEEYIQRIATETAR